jgi:TP901 family phage tail tape measure protein
VSDGLDVTLTIRGRNQFGQVAASVKRDLDKLAKAAAKINGEGGGSTRGPKLLTAELAKQREQIRQANKEMTAQARLALGITTSTKATTNATREQVKVSRMLTLEQAKQRAQTQAHNRKMMAEANRVLGTTPKRGFDPDAPATNMRIAAGAADRFATRGRQAFTSVTQSAADYGRKVAEVSTLTRSMSQADIAGIAGQAAREFGSMPVDQAAALYEIVSAGATTSAEANSLLTASNKLAIGGVTDVTSGFDALNAIMKPYGMAATDAGKASDMLFATMRVGKTTIGELSQNLAKVTPIASAVGVSQEEVLAGIATITTSTGASTETATTQLGELSAKILKPSKQSQKELRRLGIVSTETGKRIKSLRQLVDERGLAGALEAINKSRKANKNTIGLIFEDQNAIKAALTLTNQAELYGSSLDAVTNSAGETEAANAIMADSTAQKLAKANAQWELFKIKAGEALIPTLTKALPLLEKTLDAVSSFADRHPDIMSALLGGGAVAVGAATVAAPLLHAGAGLAGLMGGTGFGAFAGGGGAAATTTATANVTALGKAASAARLGVAALGAAAVAGATGFAVGALIDQRLGISDKIGENLGARATQSVDELVGRTGTRGQAGVDTRIDDPSRAAAMARRGDMIGALATDYERTKNKSQRFTGEGLTKVGGALAVTGIGTAVGLSLAGVGAGLGARSQAHGEVATEQQTQLRNELLGLAMDALRTTSQADPNYTKQLESLVKLAEKGIVIRVEAGGQTQKTTIGGAGANRGSVLEVSA